MESFKIKNSYQLLFDALLIGHRAQGKEGALYKDFLHNKPKLYLEQSNDVQQVIDYMAGMTNSFFLKQVNRFLVPQTIAWDL